MDSKTLAHFLLSKNYDVIMTYRRNTLQNNEELRKLYTEELKNSNCSLQFRFMDITDYNSVINCVNEILNDFGKIDEFYNLAAQSHVKISFDNPIYTMRANGEAVFNLLDVLQKRVSKVKFYQASTSELFGGNVARCPFNEKTPFEPRSPYSISKMMGYNWVYYFRQTHGMFACNGILFNHSNVYRGLDFYIRKLTNTAAKIALGKEKELVLGNIDHWRDEHYSDFGIELMWKMLQKDKPDDYVVGNGVCYHGEEYLTQTFECFNLDWKKYVKFDDKFKRANEVVKLVSDPSKAVVELGWRPNRITFKKHIELMCHYDYSLEAGVPPKRPDVFKMFP